MILICSISLEKTLARHIFSVGLKGRSCNIYGFGLFYAPCGLGPPGHRAFGLVVCAYVRPSVDQVKMFVQGSISRPINGSKLIFHMRMYLYETNRNIQEP